MAAVVLAGGGAGAGGDAVVSAVVGVEAPVLEVESPALGSGVEVVVALVSVGAAGVVAVVVSVVEVVSVALVVSVTPGTVVTVVETVGSTGEDVVLAVAMAPAETAVAAAKPTTRATP
ncbi:MAG: hypothetical protein ACJ780_28270 [Solirubrobacteraceae bacterium]